MTNISNTNHTFALLNINGIVIITNRTIQNYA